MGEFIGVYICLPLYFIGVLLLGTSVTVAVFVFHVVCVPLIFRFSKTFRRNLIFVNFVQWPPNIDFEEPSLSGIDGGRNLSIEYQSKVDKCKVKIGIWHILPGSVYERLKGRFDKTTDKEELHKMLDEELINTKTPIMLYFHGNSNSRVAHHRIELYQLFQQMDFHTIAFDYRGYGDSTQLRPTEDGVVEDSLILYDWLLNKLKKNGRRPAIFVWGHSLGTAISSHLFGNLSELSWTYMSKTVPPPLPDGLILEAPFNNLADEVANIPVTKLVTWLPYYDSAIVNPFRTYPEQRFKSDEHLSRVRSLPILILHAKDDGIVPFIVGLKLYRYVLASRSEGDAPIILHAYENKDGLGHKWICRAKDLPKVVGEFVASHK